MTDHPVARLLGEAMAGRFPAVDGGWTRVEPWAPGLEAVLAFTGHAVIAVGSDVSDRRLASWGMDGLGRAHDPRLVADLAGRGGWVDSLDAVLVTRGAGGRPGEGGELVPRPDLEDHPRVAYARGVRRDVHAYGRPTGRDVVVTLGQGLGGLNELGVELGGAALGTGGAAYLIGQARALVPTSEPLVAAVAPGNARALRAFLSAGFRPVASVQLWRPSPHR
ncbi:MAG: N-acetyltransferase [Lapillicoccus sp.]